MSNIKIALMSMIAMGVTSIAIVVAIEIVTSLAIVTALAMVMIIEISIS